MLEIPTTIKNKELVKKKREQIILAAIRLFSQKGFHKTTLKGLAAEAGISQGSIYDYIGTKEDIFFLIHDYLASIVQDQLILNMDKAEDPLEKLKELVQAEFEMMYQWSDAVLLIYQESHNLSKPLRKSLLQKEKRHAVIFEDVVKECVARGELRDFDSQIVAALLLGAIHSYALRRWDLGKSFSIKEMERLIIDLFYHGLLQKEPAGERGVHQESKPMAGRTALIIDGGTRISRFLTPFLLGKGARVAVHGTSPTNGLEISGLDRGDSEQATTYLTKDYGELTPHLFEQIVQDFGEISVVIHDLSSGGEGLGSSFASFSGARRVQANFRCTEDLPAMLDKCMNKSGSGRIVYLAPMAWDKYGSPLNYEIARAGSAALTKSMAKRLAPSRITVNCVVPGFVSGVYPPDLEREKAPEIMNTVPFKGLGDVQDVLEAISYLISEAAKHVTGQILDISGGGS